MKHAIYYLRIALAVAYLGDWTARGAIAGELVPIGLKKQLLVDDYVIAKKDNLGRVLALPKCEISVIFSSFGFLSALGFSEFVICLIGQRHLET